MKNIIEIKVDKSCEMAQVSLNGKIIMCGNFWDFHPRCHGIYEYGDWNCYNGLANNIALKVGNAEIIKLEYSYEKFS